MAVHAREPYRRILVPVSANGTCGESVAIACRLAADRGAELTVLSVVEVPAHLPLEAHMDAEDDAARLVVAEGRGIADLYGVAASTRVIRARSVAEAIAACAAETGAQLVVVGTPRRRDRRRQVPVIGRTVAAVLAHAPCRVLVAAR